MISKGNHVKFTRFVLLAVSQEAKIWLPFSLHSVYMYNKAIIRFWISQRPHPIIVYNYRYVWIIYRYLGFSQISYRAFPFHLIFLSEFSVEWRAFRKLYNFGCSGNFAGKFPYHLSVFRNFQSFWLNGKCPIFPRFLYTIASDLHLISVECATSSSFKLLFTLYWQPLCYMASKPWSVN